MTIPTTPPPAHPWKTLLRVGSPRATRAMLLAFVLMLWLGFALATQVRQTSTQGLSTLREDELVRLLENVQRDNVRLAAEQQALQAERDKLVSGQESTAEARAAIQQRIDTLGILTGTLPAKGPGIELTISDPKGAVTAPLLLDAVEELRDAGAEAIQIDDVRVVASTYFTDGGTGVVSLSGTRLTAPYVIRAIGDPNTLAAAMEIPGGVSDTMRQASASMTSTRPNVVRVDALQTIPPARYARPVPTPSGVAS